MPIWEMNSGKADGIVRKEIILVDDNATVLTMCRNILKTFYKVYAASSSGALFEILEKTTPDLILLDIEMPEESGYDIIKKLKADPRLADVPVIFLTMKNDENSELQGFYLGAADYIFKPFSAPLLLRRVENLLLAADQRKAAMANAAASENRANTLEIQLNRKEDKLTSLKNALFSVIGDMVEFRDGLTGGHNSRCSLYMECLINEMIREKVYVDEIANWQMDSFMASVPLHDVGKIAIPDYILNKPGSLSQEEVELVRTHVTAGIDAIEKIIERAGQHVFLRHALHLVGTHHERWDGTGYPMRLRGEKIPLEGRMMAIVDVYDALISKRPYKEAFSHEATCKIIRDGAGTHFDPFLVDVFLRVEKDFFRVAQGHGESREIMVEPTRQIYQFDTAPEYPENNSIFRMEANALKEKRA